MPKEKDVSKKQDAESKKHIDPGKIKGKIEVPDKRERRDGPGGN